MPVPSASSAPPASPDYQPSSPLLIGLAWLAVGIPLLWGVWRTLQKAAVLFS